MAPRRTSEVFNGSMGQGLDVKATTRSFSRGEGKIYVRNEASRPTRRRTSGGSSVPEENAFPHVWIFSTEQNHAGAAWDIFCDPIRRLAPYFEHRDTARSLSRRGDTALMAINYGPSRPDRELSRPGCPVRRTEVHGCVQFYPTMFTVKQASFWIENRRPTPVCNLGWGGGRNLPRGIVSYFKAQSCPLSTSCWQLALIQMGLPFAAERMNVIVPDQHVVPESIHRDAARRGVQLQIMPHSLFPREWIEKGATRTMIPTVGREPVTDDPIYPAHVESVLRQPKTANRHLVPREWTEYGCRPRVEGPPAR